MSVASDTKQKPNSRQSEWGWSALVTWCIVLVAIVGAAILWVR
jgi:hypothetical protein